MLNCKQTSQLVSQSLERKLNWREQFGIRLHLFMCKNCRRFGQQLLAMRAGFKKICRAIENDSSIQLSQKAKARIKKALADKEQ